LTIQGKNMSHRSGNEVAGTGIRWSAAAVLGLAASPAFAHVGEHGAMALGAGFMHPFSGLDHLLAMIAVGLWAAQMKGNARWALPLTSPLMMAAGAAPALAGMVLPGIETGIAASVALLGMLIAFAIRVPTWLAAALVAVFALVHGYAHGAELPQQASAGLYGIGFIAATGLLHLTGLSAGAFAARKMSLRVAGSGIAAYGVYLISVV
jgi:urease accessory protein